MSFHQTSSQTFFQRAQREAWRYGQDPFVFLRELVQNSRDAQATLIEISTSMEDGKETLICRDNGTGMDVEDMDRYLLRLYASSKEQQGDMVGFFGVGFWSILLFGPARIEVSSCQDGVSNGFVIDCRNFQIEPLPPREPRKGVQVTLVREAASGVDLAKVVRERLLAYVSHVRPLNPKGTLNLFCNGELLNREFPLPEKWGKRFGNRHFDGVLGFGATPSVKLYKGGILIRDLTSLEEVIPRRETTVPYSSSGLYPVIAMNIEGLQILMDRQKIYEDDILHKAVAFCEKMLFKQHKKLIHDLFPMNLKNNILSLKSHVNLKKLFVPLAIVVSLGIIYFIPSYLSSITRSRDSPLNRIRPSKTASLDEALHSYQGPMAKEPGNPNFSWDFQYEGPNTILFRMSTFNYHHLQKGLLPEPHIPQGLYPSIVSKGLGIKVYMGVGGALPTTLPTPPGYILDRSSVLMEGKPTRVWVNAFGEPFIDPKSPGRITYTVHPGNLQRPSQPPETDIVWPEPWQSAVKESMGLPPNLTARRLALLVKDHLSYSQVIDLENAPGGSWLERVISAGGGDCDILNGLLVLLLKSAGVEAYLSVGLIGQNGKANQELHAWVRYRDEEWNLLDVTLSHTHGPGMPATSESQLHANDPFPMISLPPPEIMPSTRGARTWWWAPLLVAVLSGLVWVRWRKSRGAHSPSHEPEYIGNLFLHYYSNGAVTDPLNLAFRPVFPLINRSRCLSLFEVEKYSGKVPILGAFPNSALLPHLKQSYPVLDRSNPVTEKLAPLLPGVIWLEDMEPILRQNPLPDFLNRVQSLIWELDPDFRLHLVPGKKTFVEVQLTFKNPALGKNHLFIGENHPLIHSMASKGGGTNDPISIFDTVSVLTEKLTFYLQVRDRFLTGVSKRLWKEAVKP